MATYNSPAVTNSTPVASHGIAGNVKVMTATVACAASPATTDTINFFTMPKNSKVHFAALYSTDMDTNGSPALTLNVGDAGSATRLFSGSTVGQAGTLSSAVAVTGFEYQYTADTAITATAGVNAATGAAGSVTLTVFYTLEGGAS
jgi:hypothetical protein